MPCSDAGVATNNVTDYKMAVTLSGTVNLAT